MSERMETKITREEMIDWFGTDMPMEAVNLVWNSDGDKTLGEIRSELRAMGEKHKARQRIGGFELCCEAYWNAGVSTGYATGKWDTQPEDQKQAVRQRMRAAVAALADATTHETDQPSYQTGEWSRKNVEAYIDAILTEFGPQRDAGTADEHGVPRAEE